MRGVSLEFDGLRLRGFSRAGDETWFRVDPPGLALDVGRGAGPLVGVQWIFLSHGHLDHSLGLPWLLSQRKLQGLDPPTVFCPAEISRDVAEFVRSASCLEGPAAESEPEFQLVGLEPGDSRSLTQDLRLETFASSHVVPSLGCHLVRSVERLKACYSGRTPDQVAELKSSGETVVDREDEVEMSYCGDTGPDIFGSEPRIFEAKTLLIECTFAGSETEHLGTSFGHLHIRDFVDNAKRFRNKAIVLSHLSRRHRAAEFEREVQRLLPDLFSRIRFVPGTGRSVGGR